MFAKEDTLMFKKLMIIIVVQICLAGPLFAANYPLEIIQPQPNLSTANRYYKAYPGLEYKVPIGVLGGAYPFTYELMTAPNGMIIDSKSGVITWQNPTQSGSPHQVSVRVTDYEQNTVTISWPITVTTSGFVFLDSVNGSHTATGTINDPLRNMVDIGGSTYDDIRDGRYNDYFIYFRNGTYDPAGYLNNSGQQIQLEWRGSYKPNVWLEYPGETVIIDHDRTASGAFLDMIDSDNNDIYIHGIRFQDMLNHAIRMLGNRQVFFECEFENLGPGQDGANSSFLMFSTSGGTGGQDYPFIKNCRFNNLNTGAFIKLYSTWKILIEGNTFSNGSGSPLEGVASKAYNTRVDIRANIFDNIREHVIAGNWNTDSGLEIRFNNVKNANNNYSSSIHGALTANYHDTAGVAFIHHNTFDGTVTVKWGTTGDGPFHFYNNVIVNQNSGVSGSHINLYSVDDPSRVVIGSGQNINLVGYPDANIIDSNGSLASAYSSYGGTHGHEARSIPAPRNLQRISSNP